MHKLCYNIQMTRDKYTLELEDDNWVLYRDTEGFHYSYTVIESKDLNEIFLTMFRDKAVRGNGNSMVIG